MSHSEYKTRNTLVMITVVSAMHQYQGASGLLVALVVLHLSLAHMDGWDDPSLTGSNMGLRIMKRGGQRQSIFGILGGNHTRYPDILQMLKRNVIKMNMVSNQRKNWVNLILSFFLVQDDSGVQSTDNRYGAFGGTSGEPTRIKRLNKTERPMFLLLDPN
jgi:hypothetical protein